MRELTERQLQVTTARLSIVAALRVLHALPTPEETAERIAAALGDLPLVDIALVLELTDDGLLVLATAGRKPHLIHYAGPLPPARTAYLLDRSRHGAWGELWADRPELGEDKRLTQPGTEGQAFAPILSEGHIVGLIAIATADPGQANHLVADLPSISEAAAVASAILAPALATRRQLSSTRVQIAETIASGAFHPVFQPIVDLETGLTVGFEALTRFATGDDPARMFADAARVGLGPALEAATLTAALRDAARLPPHGWLALNISPTLLGECRSLTTILANRTRPITLEITEHEIIDDYGPLHAAMRTLGPDVRLAVDDAGAGVANFQHLVELRPALVKIDAGLIRGVNADLSRQALIVGLVHFAAASGALVLAEGIETQAEEETVQRLGVTLGQGYRLARAAPIEQWVHADRSLRSTARLAKVIPISRPARLNSGNAPAEAARARKARTARPDG
jgi:EAL domain-containing protein (putative c-di-GMP-specific phosphodiesterase class I)